MNTDSTDVSFTALVGRSPIRVGLSNFPLSETTDNLFQERCDQWFLTASRGLIYCVHDNIEQVDTNPGYSGLLRPAGPVDPQPRLEVLFDLFQDNLVATERVGVTEESSEVTEMGSLKIDIGFGKAMLAATKVIPHSILKGGYLLLRFDWALSYAADNEATRIDPVWNRLLPRVKAMEQLFDTVQRTECFRLVSVVFSDRSYFFPAKRKHT